MGSYEKMFKNICRVCLSQKNTTNMVLLTEKSSDDGLSCYGKAITILTSVSLRKDDKLPKMMCQNCVLLLRHAILFKMRCESSDQNLKKLINPYINKDTSDENIKEIVCEYVMYNHYFHDETSLEDSSTVNKRKKVTKSSELRHKNYQKNSKDKVEIHVDTIYNFAENNHEDINNSLFDNNDPSNEEIDSMLNTMQHIVDTEPNTEMKTYKKPAKRKQNRVRKLVSKDKYKISKRQLKRQNHQKYLMKFRKAQRDIECKICNKVLANRMTFKHHMDRHNIQDCRFICDQCGKAFPVLIEMHMHQVTKHGIGPYLQCNHCPYKAPRKLDLIEHIRLHTGERPFTCEKCGKSFRRKAIWKNHIIRHMDRQFQCTYCPKKFFKHYQMLEHCNNIHERSYMYMCNVCNVLYSTIKTVRRHMLAKHGVPRERQGKIFRVTNTQSINEFSGK